jgi:hypothetical protein
VTRSLFLVPLVASLALGCSVGDGEGWVRSDRLFIEDCWSGTFDLGPDFFAGNSFRGESVLFRVQRGDNIEELSDGLVIVVNDLQELRGQLGVPVEVGLPPGVQPPGQPVVADPEPPSVSLGLYLHDSCHVQNGTVYSIAGNITFSSLWSGDQNEETADERLTEASFDATFADPRLLVGEGSADPNLSSRVTGYFRFFFQRGQPAQPFQ